MPKLTTHKAIKKAALSWQIKLNNVSVFYKWSKKPIPEPPFILIDYGRKEWLVNYITKTNIYYATIDDITGHCSTNIVEFINI